MSTKVVGPIMGFPTAVDAARGTSVRFAHNMRPGKAEGHGSLS